MNRKLIRDMARKVDMLEALEGLFLDDGSASSLQVTGRSAGQLFQSWWAQQGRDICWQLFREWVAAQRAELESANEAAVDQLVTEVQAAKAEAVIEEVLPAEQGVAG